MIYDPTGPWADAFRAVCLTMAGDLPAGPDRRHCLTVTRRAFAASAAAYRRQHGQYGAAGVVPTADLAVDALNRMANRCRDGQMTGDRLKGWGYAHLMRVHFDDLRFLRFGPAADAAFSVALTGDGRAAPALVHVVLPVTGANRDGFSGTALNRQWFARADDTLVGFVRFLYEPVYGRIPMAATPAEAESSAYRLGAMGNAAQMTATTVAVMADACDEAGLHQSVGEMLREGGAAAVRALHLIADAECDRSAGLLAAALGYPWPPSLPTPRTEQRLFAPAFTPQRR